MEKKFDGKLLAFTGMIYLLVFQSPLEGVWRAFSYIDEAVVLLGILWAIHKVMIKKAFDFPGYMVAATVCLTVFSVVGLLGNILYRYQPWKSAIVDLYTNLKYFFAILTGYAVCSTIELDHIKKQVNLHGRIIAVVLFAVFVLDRMFNFWPSGIRFGIKSAVLFYAHPTYLAGAAAFLTALMTVFYEKKNIPFIAMCLTLLMFTLRSKAFGSAAVFAAMFVVFILLKRKIKLWHILLAAVGCIIIAWPQISYYFIELGGRSTRSVMHSVAVQIMKDYFPIGTGFGTYASSEAEKVFSPVYQIYNFEYLLRFEVDRQWLHFLNDTFWPIIMGQTGAIGTIAYVSAQGLLFSRSWKIQQVSMCAFAAVMYIWAHLLICSTAEPSFNNATAVPLALIIGIVLCAADKKMLDKNLLQESKQQVTC